jgi:hypothetical protein
VHVGVSRNAFHIAERLLEGLTKRDANIFGGMVMVNVQVAFGLDGDVDARMPRKQVEHMVKEAYAGRDRCAARSVEIDFNLNVGFLGLALNGTLAHANVLYSRAFYQGFAGFATALRMVGKYDAS